MEISRVETKDYKFYWSVDPYGYELVDEALYKFPGTVSGTPFGRYYPAHIFFKTELNARRWHGELTPNYPDNLAPWLVLKGTQSYHKEFVLAAEKKIQAADLGRITEKYLEGIPPTGRMYEPLSDPVLHRTFARLKTEDIESEVIRFANKYGLLGRDVILHPANPVSPPVHGESLYRWRAEIEKMGVLLAIWDWVEREEAGKLGQIVIWPSPEAVMVRFKWKSQKGHYEILPWSEEDYIGLDRDYNSAVEYENESDYAYVGELLANDEVLTRDKKPSPFFQQYRRGEVLGPARHYLCQMLNYHLRGITPNLVPWLGYKVAFMPDSLLDVLWLMFMLEVNGEVRTCWYCRGPHKPTRKDNVYCSNRCKRMAYYYDKQRKGGAK